VCVRGAQNVERAAYFGVVLVIGRAGEEHRGGCYTVQSIHVDRDLPNPLKCSPKAGAAASGSPKGSVLTMLFQLDGQEFLALNGGPHFKFSPAISFIANCETQKEIDELWKKLSEGGETEQCGWLRDKFGVSWQIVPADIGKMMQDKDAEKADRVMRAILQMSKNRDQKTEGGL